MSRALLLALCCCCCHRCFDLLSGLWLGQIGQFLVVVVVVVIVEVVEEIVVAKTKNK